MSWFYFFLILDWSIRLIMLLVILRRRLLPNVALAWLMIIFLLPEIGLIFYVLFGDARLGRKRTRLHRRIVEASRKHERMTCQNPFVARPAIAPELEPVILQGEVLGGMSILGGNDVTFLGDTSKLIDSVVADIDKAKHHVHLMFYIYADDETGRRVSEALARAAKRGVFCRLLVDGGGSPAFIRRGAMDRLRAEGVRVEVALPVRPLRRRLARMDVRNHRKLILVDGRIAYAGSHNIVNPDYGKGAFGSKMAWIDLTARFTGPIVHQLQIVFLEDWAFEMGEQLGDEQTLEKMKQETGVDMEDPAQMEKLAKRYLPPLKPTGEVAAQTVPTGPSEDDDEALPNVVLAAINAARRKIMITTPYFIPDEPMLLALCMAAARGVEVMLILPKRSDMPLVILAAKFYYEPLLRAGVHIHEHGVGLLHSKIVTVDDGIALLGSTNMDIRSFRLNFELNVLMYGPEITARLRQAQTSYLADCKVIKLEEWRKRPAYKRYACSAAALLSPLL